MGVVGHGQKSVLFEEQTEELTGRRRTILFFVVFEWRSFSEFFLAACLIVEKMYPQNK
jgi:hypothetical protein